MFTSTFAKHRYDDDFHALDAVIAEVARAIPGYLGEEAWENAEAALISNVHDWDSMGTRAQGLSGGDRAGGAHLWRQGHPASARVGHLIRIKGRDGFHLCPY